MSLVSPLFPLGYCVNSREILNLEDVLSSTFIKFHEDAHRSIRDDLCDLKVASATIQTDVEWMKKELTRD